MRRLQFWRPQWLSWCDIWSTLGTVTVALPLATFDAEKNERGYGNRDRTEVSGPQRGLAKACDGAFQPAPSLSCFGRAIVNARAHRKQRRRHRYHKIQESRDA